MLKNSLIFIVLVLILLAIAGYFYYHYVVVKGVEQPKYQVLKSDGAIEVRQYAPYLTASVEVDGTRRQAANQGFRVLANYIFGHFETQGSKAQPIAMTAPVSQHAQAQGADKTASDEQKIAMTSPVMEQRVDGQRWVITFSMPSKYTQQTLPKPKNTSIHIKKWPSQQYVVIRFSGSADAHHLADQLKKLQTYISRYHLKLLDHNPIYAFYDPPWTLPFLKRNEIMFRLVGKD